VDDPIETYGYSIVSYLNIIWVMFGAFFVLSVLQIPSLLIYASGEGYR
jgi:hypothetical protein